MAIPDTDAALGRRLLCIARAAIADRLGLSAPACALDDPRLAAAGASFVTLTRAGALRGCIGSLEAFRPLADDVAENAQAAAFRDPRFTPLSAGEWPDTQVEVSLLSRPEPLVVGSEAAALSALRPGVDGIVFDCAGRRATFLPQVWESLPEPAEFLRRLKEKAGLDAGFWRDDVRLSRYTVRKWREGEADE